MWPFEKKTIKLLREIERSFPGDSLVNDSPFPSKTGVSEETFHTLKILEKSGLIVAIKYGIEGLPESEPIKHIEAIKITPLGLEFLNGLKQRRTNVLIVLLTILTVLIGGAQIYLLLK